MPARGNKPQPAGWITVKEAWERVGKCVSIETIRKAARAGAIGRIQDPNHGPGYLYSAKDVVRCHTNYGSGLWPSPAPAAKKTKRKKPRPVGTKRRPGMEAAVTIAGVLKEVPDEKWDNVLEVAQLLASTDL